MGPSSTHWRELHLSLEHFWSSYSSHDGIAGLHALRRALNPATPRALVEVDIVNLGLPINLAADWLDLERLRRFLQLPGGLDNPKAPAASVYQAACVIRKTIINAYGREDDYWFYRGQRDRRWDCMPKIMRPLRGMHPDRSEAELQASLRQLRLLVSRIRRAGLAENDFDATAIAQHYSAELGVGTWLIDVTSSPWVALFFASDGGRAGDIGVIDFIIRTEWARFSSDGATALGALRVASVTSVPRINHQKGFFLQAPHPDLFNELVPLKLYFAQEDGVVFESPALVPAIDRGWIYPEKDEVLETIVATSADVAIEPRALAWEPSASMIGAPTGETYLPIAHALLEHNRRKQPELAARTRLLDWDAVLRELSLLHAVVRKHADRVPRYVTTLHHFERVVGTVMAYGMNGLSGLLRGSYFDYCTNDSERFILMQCLWVASPFWNQAVQNRLSGSWPQR